MQIRALVAVEKYQPTMEERREELYLLSGEQHIPPLVNLPDESLCFSHTVVALALPLQMFHLEVIQLGSKEIGTPEVQRIEVREATTK